MLDPMHVRNSFCFVYFDIFVLSLGCLVLYKKHVRFGLIAVLLLALKLCFLVCMCAHTYVCISILEAYVGILMYVYTYSCPEI